MHDSKRPVEDGNGWDIWVRHLQNELGVLNADLVIEGQCEAAPSLSDLPVDSIASEYILEAHVVLGRFAISLRELAAIKPGTRLRGELGDGAPVELRIGGECIASGTLVQLGDVIAFEVVSLSEEK